MTCTSANKNAETVSTVSNISGSSVVVTGISNCYDYFHLADLLFVPVLFRQRMCISYGVEMLTTCQ